MDYTNMTFGDVLVADIGDLPKHTRINEDIYDLLTLPYTFGSGARARLLSARMPRNDEGSRYSLTTFITKGNVEAVLKTKLTDAIDEIYTQITNPLSNVLDVLLAEEAVDDEDYGQWI